jgi:hypothetical protein
MIGFSFKWAMAMQGMDRIDAEKFLVAKGWTDGQAATVVALHIQAGSQKLDSPDKWATKDLADSIHTMQSLKW